MSQMCYLILLQRSLSSDDVQCSSATKALSCMVSCVCRWFCCAVFRTEVGPSSRTLRRSRTCTTLKSREEMCWPAGSPWNRWTANRKLIEELLQVFVTCQTQDCRTSFCHDRTRRQACHANLLRTRARLAAASLPNVPHLQMRL